jgi:tetratricopeptide (TPR) repeat protein
MGSGASSRRALSEKDIKKEIGVLYDETAKRAFDGAATEKDGTRSAPWEAIEAHARTDPRLRDPRYALYQNLKGFKAAREQIDEIARVYITAAVWKIPAVGKNLGDDRRQCGLDGEPAASLDALYEVAKLANVQFEEIMRAACPDGVTLKIAPLKGRDRAEDKARDEYKDMTAPCYSWLFDVVRGSVLCETEADIVSLYEALEANPDIEIARVKNRFDPPLFNGYRDILMNVAVKVKNVSHLCELQIHLKAIKDSEALHRSHTVYEFFRSFFVGNDEAYERRLKLLTALPVDNANTLVELVDLVIGANAADFRRKEDLNSLSISELKAVAKERGVDISSCIASGPAPARSPIKDMKATIKRAGLSTSDLLERQQVEERYEMALARLAEAERAKGSPTSPDGRHSPVIAHESDAMKAEIVRTLHDAALNSLPISDLKTLAQEQGVDISSCVEKRGILEMLRAPGECERMLTLSLDRLTHEKQLKSLCELLESIQEFAGVVKVQEAIVDVKIRRFGPESEEAGDALCSLGLAYQDHGDYAKARDTYERALPIRERNYGSFSPWVAELLGNIGNAHGFLGDHAKERDMQERALAIYEQGCGKDHISVAITLGNLATAYANLGDHAKARDMQERALKIKEREYGSDHWQVALTLGNLGNEYGALGDHEKTREMQERALEIKQKAYGRDHPEVAITLGNLGRVYGDLGDQKKARDMQERALAIKERTYGHDHPNVAQTLMNLVTVHEKLGNHTKKRELLERIRAMNHRD